MGPSQSIEGVPPAIVVATEEPVAVHDAPSISVAVPASSSSRPPDVTLLPSPTETLADEKREINGHVEPSPRTVEPATSTEEQGVTPPTGPDEPAATDVNAMDVAPSIQHAEMHRDPPGPVEAPSDGPLRELTAAQQQRQDRPLVPTAKLAAVVLEKRSGTSDGDMRSGLHSRRRPEATGDADYMRPLFVTQAYSPPRAPLLSHLLTTAHKTVTTANHHLDLHEQQDARMLKRIYQLQAANKWSLRQPPRASEPARSSTHWDALLEHVRWMRTDFREERKWKVMTARNLARACARWVGSSPEDRRTMQIRTRPPRSMVLPETVQERRTDEHGDAGPTWKARETASPAKVFALDVQDMAWTMHETSSGLQLLQELPCYDVPDMLPSDQTPDDSWKQAMVPVSKYLTAKIDLPRSTLMHPLWEEYEYDRDERMSEDPPAEPGQEDAMSEHNTVALFKPENKPIRDRLHAGHSFRPPTEFSMPPPSFFESRHSSQWTAAEEEELRALVKRYSYNWSLIADLLSSRSSFTSGAERRTPWECFEFWVTLEGLPAEMQKTAYFRTYHARLEAAQRTIMPPPAPAQQQTPSQAEANPNTPVRRRSTQPMRVDKRKRGRHLSLIEAMRKLAKQRETTMQKQQHGEFDLIIIRHRTFYSLDCGHISDVWGLIMIISISC